MTAAGPWTRGQAEATAAAIGSEAWQSVSLGRAAEVLARLGVADQAVITAGKIANRASQARALTGVAAALAEIGDHHRALEVLRQAGGPGRCGPIRRGQGSGQVRQRSR